MNLSNKLNMFCEIVIIAILCFLFDSFLIRFYTDYFDTVIVDTSTVTQNEHFKDCGATYCTDQVDVSISSEFYAYNKSELFEWKPALPVSVPNRYEPGENGAAVYIPENKKKLMWEQFELHQFNLMASDMISPIRSLPDVRFKECKYVKYPKYLPSTSIVIAFYNEAWSTLIRTVWSVIYRSPRSLLKEIILVDDFSGKEHLGKQLEEYVTKLPVPVRLLRMPKRLGIVKARLFGAKHVTGQVITFLDSHCECAEGWLEPLLARIVMDRKTVVCPIVDMISDKTFKYSGTTDVIWGGFTWELYFQWFYVPIRELSRRLADRTIPLRTPVMGGSLFAIDRDYFNELGGFDEEMNIWGSEKLEMSFKIWQCGGTLEIVPCSHVGHVFLKTSRPKFPQNAKKSVLYNIVRVVEVWLDEWKEFFYLMNPEASDIRPGDVSKLKALRKKLNCKSFRWYLENVYPETQLPFDYYHLGWIRNVQTGECLDKTYGLKLSPCCCTNQVFVYTKRKQILSNDWCLSAEAIDEPVLLLMCHEVDGSQEWIYNEKEKQIIHMNTGGCLQRINDAIYTLRIRHCVPNTLSQQWLMDVELKWQLNYNDTKRYSYGD